MTTPSPPRDRSLAIRRGLFGKCPQCGTGTLFQGYLSVVPRCATCATDLTPYRAADGPAFVTVTVVGLLLVPVMGWMFVAMRPDPLVMALSISIILTVVSLGMLRIAKGAVIGFMWADDAREPHA